jgi:hypothetical protein
VVATDTQKEELLEAVFSVRSVPGLYNDGQLLLEESLETAMRRIGGWCEMAASLVVSEVELVGEQSDRGLLRFSRCELLL